MLAYTVTDVVIEQCQPHSEEQQRKSDQHDATHPFLSLSLECGLQLKLTENFAQLAVGIALRYLFRDAVVVRSDRDSAFAGDFRESTFNHGVCFCLVLIVQR